MKKIMEFLIRVLAWTIAIIIASLILRALGL